MAFLAPRHSPASRHRYRMSFGWLPRHVHTLRRFPLSSRTKSPWPFPPYRWPHDSAAVVALPFPASRFKQIPHEPSISRCCSAFGSVTEHAVSSIVPSWPSVGFVPLRGFLPPLRHRNDDATAFVTLLEGDPPSRGADPCVLGSTRPFGCHPEWVLGSHQALERCSSAAPMAHIVGLSIRDVVADFPYAFWVRHTGAKPSRWPEMCFRA